MFEDREHRRLIAKVVGYLGERPEYHTVRAHLEGYPPPNPVNGEQPDITAFRRNQFVIFRAFPEGALRSESFERLSRAFAHSASFEHIRYHVIVPERCTDEAGLELARRRIQETGVKVDNIWFC
jgi:hypothetical protein